MGRNVLEKQSKLSKCKPKLGRLEKHLLKGTIDTAREFVNNIIGRYKLFKENDYERQLVNEAAFLVCPASIESSEDGIGVIINKNKFATLTYVASPSKTDPTETGIDKRADPFVMDTILEVAEKKKFDLTLTQVLYKLSSHQNTKETDKELSNLEKIKNIELKQDGRYSLRLDHQEQDIEILSKQEFDGEHKSFKQLYIARIDGDNPSEVEMNTHLLGLKLRSAGLYSYVPYGDQIGAMRGSLPSNEFDTKSLGKIMSNVAAAMWPGRSTIKQLDQEGIIIGFSRDGVPVYWNPEDPKYNSKHLAVFGGSGVGKSTLLLYMDYNSIAANCDFVHIFPKQDFGTSAIRMIEAIGGQLIKIGESGQCFNPLMVFYDPKIHGKDIRQITMAYAKHKGAVTNFFSMVIGTAFSKAMSGVFKLSLSELYRDFELVDKQAHPINLDKWEDGKNWPSLGDLLKKWEKWLAQAIEKTAHMKDKASIQALINYMTDILPGEELHWLDNKETFKPSGRYICIDVSEIPEGYKDAVTVLLVDIINSRMKSPNEAAYKAKRRTLIMPDEGAALLENPGMQKHIKKWFREARSGKCSIILDNQDLEGVNVLLPVLKANTDATIFMCGMSEEDIEEFSKEYKFSAKDKAILKTPCINKADKGKFLFYMNGLHVPGQVQLSGIQKKIFFDEHNDIPLSDECNSIYDYELLEGLEWIRDKGVMSESWLSNKLDVNIKGFSRGKNLTPPTDDMSKVIWLSDDIAKLDKICGESQDHYTTCCLMAGQLQLAGCTEVDVHNYGGQGVEDADVTCVMPDGRVLWVEYAHPGSRTKKQIEEQKNKQMRFCDKWLCVCQQKNEQDVKEAVGKDFYLVRGKGLGEFIRGIANLKNNQTGPMDEPEYAQTEG